MNTDRKPVLVVTGPTASGKSALALDLAEALDGVVINADSMQVYRDLRIVTARPSEGDAARAPHRLYGFLDAAEVCSAVSWRSLALAEIDAAHAVGRLPILCGGTGLYLKALMEGFAPTPDVPPAVRESVRARMAGHGAPAMHGELARRDPEMASRLGPTDSQRIARALEVVEATGRSLADWQREPHPPPPARLGFHVVAMLPPRDLLYDAIDRRFRRMVESGALDEVAALLDRGLSRTLPAMKALGVPELAAYLAGETDLDSAVDSAATKTRRYAKRQMTWLRRQIIIDEIISEKYSESLCVKIIALIRESGLTR